MPMNKASNALVERPWPVENAAPEVPTQSPSESPWTTAGYPSRRASGWNEPGSASIRRASSVGGVSWSRSMPSTQRRNRSQAGTSTRRDHVAKYRRPTLAPNDPTVISVPLRVASCRCDAWSTVSLMQTEIKCNGPPWSSGR